MKVTSEPTDDCQVVLTIEVEPERVEQSIDRAYRRLATKANIPGFRKGKAPRPLVERFLGGRTALLEDALERLVPEVYAEAIKEQQIEPVAQPQFEVTQLEPVTVKATVSLPPKVELGEYQSVRQPAPQVEVTEQDVDEILESLRERQAIWEPVDRPVELGDRVVVDLDGTRDGEPLGAKPGAEYDVLADNQAPVPGFAQELVGLTKDETKTIDLSFAADDERAAFAGKQYQFTVTVREVKAKRLPEVGDEFAKLAGEGIESVEQLKERIRENTRLRKEFEARERLENDVIKSVADAATVVVPPALVEREMDLMLQQQEQALAEQRISLQQYLKFMGKEPQAYREDLRESAGRRLRQKLVLERVAEAEGLKIPEEEIDRELAHLASHQTGQAEAAPASVRTAVERILQRRHALDRLVEIATEGAVKPHQGPEPPEPSEVVAEIAAAAEKEA